MLKLPQRDPNSSAAADDLLKLKVEEVMQDFIDEIEVCCDLNHPNLARLLGCKYTQPHMPPQLEVRGCL